jgi:DNA-binding GntR family transcriptional regulator
MGFFSNDDKRIPVRYECPTCSDKSIDRKFFQKLCQIRRTLSIVYNEGIKSIPEFSKRSGFEIATARETVDSLANEGFLKIWDRSHIEVLKTPENRDKLKLYFQNNVVDEQGLKNAISSRYQSAPRQVRKKSSKNLDFDDSQNAFQSDQKEAKKRKVSVSKTVLKCYNK